MGDFLSTHTFEISLVASVVVLMMVLSIATKILLRRVDRHLGILAISVDGLQDCSLMRPVSPSTVRSRPRMVSVPLIGISISKEEL